LLLSFFLTFIFLWSNVLGEEISNLLNKDTSYKVVYAKPKSSSGGFKSGSFKSSGSSSGGFKSGSFKSSGSSSGGFKSGSFSNTKKTTPPSGGYSGNSTYSGKKTSRSFLPIPIPIPWGNSYNYGTRSLGLGYGLLSMIWSLIKFIIILALIIYIIRRFRRR
jgi:hypothetical protein